jgi:MinD superfamily P-loop ATPase
MRGSRIMVTSGKGGTGKTTVAVALTVVLARGLADLQFLDCDVEEPDAALFLKPSIDETSPVTSPLPIVNADRCTGCGQCHEACQYNAIRVVSGTAVVFDNLCRGCGGCRLACQADAIGEVDRQIGVIESGSRENTVFHRGVLDVGQRIVIPIIRSLKSRARSDIPTILDSGPGTGSTVVASLKDCDYCILVTEPTPHGLYDLNLMMDVIDRLGIPAGVVINKDGAWSERLNDYASQRGLPILMRIPFSREIAALSSRGTAFTEIGESWDPAFWDMYEKVERTIWSPR